jgi:serine/threonine-protein phosphatase 2A regulatory subunit B
MQQNTSSETKEWSLRQCIGGEGGQDVTEDDLITSVNFDHTGSHMAVGDNFGRVIVFARNEDDPDSKENSTEKPKDAYRFVTELKAQNDDFDVLRSEKINPKIVDIQWIRSPGTSLNFLTASEKNINWCKASYKHKRTFRPCNSNTTDSGELEIPSAQVEDQPTWDHCIMRQYPKLHSHTINSLSVNPNGISFLSSDDLTIFMWNIDKGIKAYNLFEFKMIPGEDLSEVVTASLFSPYKESSFLFTTNKGARLCDLRQSSNTKNCMLKFEEKFTGKRNVFTEYLSYISGACFVGDDKFVTREPLQTKIWDVRITNKALEVLPLNEGIKTKLAEMFEKDLFMEKFNVSSSPCGKYLSTGFFNRSFHISSIDGSSNLEASLNNKKGIKAREIQKSATTLPSDYVVENMALKLAWNPRHNEIVVPFESSIFIYSKA